MAYIWQDPRSPYYTACWYDALGKIHRCTTKSTVKKRARKIAFEFESAERIAQQLARNKSAVNQVVEDIKLRILGETRHMPTIEEWFNQWLKEKKQVLSAGTYDRYEDTVNTFYKLVGTHIKPLRLDELTIKEIVLFRDKRIKMGTRGNTINIDVKIISSSLRKALKQNIIHSNPAEAVDPLPSLDSSERKAFTEEQISTLVKAVKDDNDWLGVVLLGLWTGQRIGDLLSLTWNAVDLEKKIITFKPQKTIRKNRIVVIPIMPDLEDWLRKQPAPFTPNQKVLAKLSNMSVGGRNGFSTEFIEILKRLGLRGETSQPRSNMRKLSSLSFHSLRHTFTSRMANNGVPAEIRMLLTGHSSLKVHQGYTHFDVDHVRELLNKIPAVA